MRTKNVKASRQCRSQQPMVGQIRKRYTRLVISEDGNSAAAYLQIDHQGFCVVEDTTPERARWFQKMLAIALHRFLLSNTNLSRGEPAAGET